MNFVDLSCFVMAAEEMNFTRAAKRLYISQQSLSSHIAKLEEHYGVRLFDRSAPLTMTREGNLLLKHARAILDEENQIKEEQFQRRSCRPFPFAGWGGSFLEMKSLIIWRK